MSKVTIDESILEDIGDSIREKLNVETTYKPSQMPDAIESIPSGYPEPTGTVSITQNGSGINVKDYASADVAVPNSYAAGDEGKVVSNGALVSQGSDTVTENDTYNTTLISSLTVNVEGGGGGGTPWADVKNNIDVIPIDSNTFRVKVKSANTQGVIIDTEGYNATIELVEWHGASIGSAGNIPQAGKCSTTATMPNVISAGTGRISYQNFSAVDQSYSYTYGSEYAYVGYYNASNSDTYAIFEVTKGANS